MSSERPRGFCCEEDLARIGCDGRGWEGDLAELRKSGPRGETRELLDAVLAEGVAGASVLDVGAGVGAVHLALLEAGAARAVDVDASRDYLAAARSEAERRNLDDRVEYRFGDLVEVADDLPPADVVTADAVICCYPNLAPLLAAMVQGGPRIVGLTYVDDAWWIRWFLHLQNRWWAFRGRPDRWYIKRHREVDRLMGEAGYGKVHDGGPWYWRVVVFRRSGSAG